MSPLLRMKWRRLPAAQKIFFSSCRPTIRLKQYDASLHLNLAAAKLVHSLADFLPGLFIFFRLAAVPFLLSLGQGNFTLGDAVTKINSQRNQGKPLCIRPSIQLFDFLAM